MTACFFLLPFAYSWRISFCCCSVTKLCLTLWSHGLQHTRLPCPSLFLTVYSNSCPLSQWCYLTISSATPFSFCLQSFPASGSFSMSRLFESGGQSIGASASVLPMNIQGWSPLGLTGLIILLSKGFSRIFSSTTVWKHRFFGYQTSSWSTSHICPWLWKTIALTIWTFVGKVMPLLFNTLSRFVNNPLQYSCLENPMDRGAW